MGRRFLPDHIIMYPIFRLYQILWKFISNNKYPIKFAQWLQKRKKHSAVGDSE